MSNRNPIKKPVIRRQRYTPAMRDFIEKHQAGMPRAKLAELFSREFGVTVTHDQMLTYCRNHKLRGNNAIDDPEGGRLRGYQYTKAQIKFLKDNSNLNRKSLTKSFNRRFSENLSVYQITEYCCFLGLVLPKGEFAPIGTIHKMSRHLEIKVADNPPVWEKLHYHNYKKAYGKVPKDHVIRFLDGDPRNCDIDNLICIPKIANFAVSNYADCRTSDPNLNKAEILMTALKTVTNNKRKNHARPKS